MPWLMHKLAGLTVASMLAIDEKELAETIHPVGFYRNKAKYIKQVASILQEQQRATGADVPDIPRTFDDLVALPGVGPKMAYLVMDCAWNEYVNSQWPLSVCLYAALMHQVARAHWQRCRHLRRHARASDLEPPRVGQDVELKEPKGAGPREDAAGACRVEICTA